MYKEQNQQDEASNSFCLKRDKRKQLKASWKRGMSSPAGKDWGFKPSSAIYYLYDLGTT